MQKQKLIPLVALALCGCGLEQMWEGGTHDDYDRPASKVQGAAPAGLTNKQLTALDPEGATLTPFQATAGGGHYEMRLPSTKYSMVRARAVTGNAELRAIVPFVGPESVITNVDLDPKNTTETLIVEAILSMRAVKNAADAKACAADPTNCPVPLTSDFKKITPAAYAGTDFASGTRGLIRRDMENGGTPAGKLYGMVKKIFAKYDPEVSVATAYFFQVPIVQAGATPGTYALKQSPIDSGFIARTPIDYDDDGALEDTTEKFDKALLDAASQPYKPEGCPDPSKIRLVFTVDFNDGAKNGNCAKSDRFKWATDRPGKSMFFVGWVHKDSPYQDPKVSAILGNSAPNNVPMYDDGTNGDEVAGDGIWTVSFEVPRDASKQLWLGYKYTWGTQGAQWSGTEEWPGNSRILVVTDDNNDGFVYRRDVFGDEATNKDKSNLNSNSATGVLDWTTDLHGCGTPETHENLYDNNSCKCLPKAALPTPKGIGPINAACP